MKEVRNTILRQFNLHDTQPRRLVLKALETMKKPASRKEIHNWIKQQDAAVNLATVYRTLQLFEKLGIVHRHPSSGGMVLCSLKNEEGHHGTIAHGATCHGFLSCEKCGKVEEFVDSKLCKEESRIAKQSGFSPSHHISEIVGVCCKCQ